VRAPVVTALADLLERIDAAPTGPQVGAFFDFDGTLIDGYSAVVVYRDRLRRLDVGPEELARMLLAVAGMQVRGSDVGALMTAALEGLAGRTDADMQAFGERIFRDGIAGMVYPGARELVRAHCRAGHTVVIATSATRYQVEPLARDLGADGLLCTHAELRDGVLTGATDGPVLWGERKGEAVRAYAAEHGIDLGASFAYGNGDEEEPLLEAVGRPAVLNPEDDIAKVAARRGWPVVRLDPPGGGFGLRPALRTGAALSAMGAAFGLGVGVRLLNGDKRMGANVATAVGANAALALAGVQVDVEGEEHVAAARPAVFVFNHQSSLDTLIIGRVLGRDVTGVAKVEARRDPRFAPLGYLIDIAYVDRSDGRRAREAMAPVVDKLRGGTSIAIAPEGTRSPTPAVGPFKKGAFHIAMQAGVPVVPVVIRNAGEVMWRNAFWLRPGRVEVRVLAPVDTSSWTARTVAGHAAEVRELFVRTLAEW
jgi:putative phosphoserine phosphatase / 1-acylglycerol-3-phosphate O-acyltransferase